MHFCLDQRTARLGVGEFAGWAIGPREPGDGQAGLWRAQLGAQWHRELRARAEQAGGATQFEVSVSGSIFHRGWTLTLEGRIDQVIPAPDGALLREIKTVLQPLPAAEEDLRAQYPAYFTQLAAYLALRRIADPTLRVRGELLFIEAAGGLAQTVPTDEADDARFDAQLAHVVEFLDLRLRARERLRALRFRPAFPSPRPGQETIQADLAAAFNGHRHVLFAAPTGYGKTGVLLEFALGQLRSGRYSRLIYLTGKTTGQLQVMRTIEAMTTPAPQQECHPLGDTLSGAPPRGVAVWNLRPKSEHCINTTFHCVRETCGFIGGLEQRWHDAGLARFHLFESEPRDLESLRRAGLEAHVCPYEISRTALAFQDVWIGDYNYVFSPTNRGVFFDQPGFSPADTLLAIDEVHNLPARVADAHSHSIQLSDAQTVLSELEHHQAARGLIRAWSAWTRFLATLPADGPLSLTAEDDLRDLLRALADQLAAAPPDYAAFDPRVSDQLWRPPVLCAWLDDLKLEKLLWSPSPGELRFTCLDAAGAISETLRDFGGIVSTTATPGPLDAFAEACGIAVDPPALLEAPAPWRDGAYHIAYDIRVDTRYRQRNLHRATTAATIEALHAAAISKLSALGSPLNAIAVFFPSYAYAEDILAALESTGSILRVALQPRGATPGSSAAWIEEALAFSDVLFLVLGGSFSEGIDLLGGRVTHAMVVGPALPEVNAIQEAKIKHTRLGREEAFRRVYQMPGLQKVNQALGRLVRAPGQHATVLLHCRRFIEPSYASLLMKEYQFGETLATDADLAAWLKDPRTSSGLPT